MVQKVQRITLKAFMMEVPCREDDQFGRKLPKIHLYQKNNTSTRFRVSYLMHFQCSLDVMNNIISKIDQKHQKILRPPSVRVLVHVSNHDYLDLNTLSKYSTTVSMTS